MTAQDNAHAVEFPDIPDHRPKLMEVVRGTLRGQPCPDPASFYRLRSGGLIRGESLQDARLRCQIYASYLQRHLR